jgi:hypothetical protein
MSWSSRHTVETSFVSPQTRDCARSAPTTPIWKGAGPCEILAPLRYAKLADAFLWAQGEDEKAARILGVTVGSARLDK